MFPDVAPFRRPLCNPLILGVQKLPRSGFKWGFGEGRLKDKVAFFEAYKEPIPKRRQLLATRPFLYEKRALLKNLFELDRVSFSTPDTLCSLIRRCS